MNRRIVGAHNPRKTAFNGSSLKKNTSETTIVPKTKIKSNNSNGLKSFINLNIVII